MTRALFFVLPAGLISGWFWHAFPRATGEIALLDIGELAWLMLLTLAFCGGVSAYRYRHIWLPAGVVTGALLSTIYVEGKHGCCMRSFPWSAQDLVFSCVVTFLVASIGWAMGWPVRKLPLFRSYAS